MNRVGDRSEAVGVEEVMEWVRVLTLSLYVRVRCPSATSLGAHVTEQVSWENIVAMKPTLQLSGAGPVSRDTSAGINHTVFGKIAETQPVATSTEEASAARQNLPCGEQRHDLTTRRCRQDVSCCRQHLPHFPHPPSCTRTLLAAVADRHRPKPKACRVQTKPPHAMLIRCASGHTTNGAYRSLQLLQSQTCALSGNAASLNPHSGPTNQIDCVHLSPSPCPRLWVDSTGPNPKGPIMDQRQGSDHVVGWERDGQAFQD